MKRAVDFDGTLAIWDGWVAIDVLGEPIKMMVDSSGVG